MKVKYKVEALDYKAELSVRRNSSLDNLFYDDRDEAWDKAEELENQNYGEFCVVEITSLN